jgi:hypothetical protein
MKYVKEIFNENKIKYVQENIHENIFFKENI